MIRSHLVFSFGLALIGFVEVGKGGGDHMQMKSINLCEIAERC